MFTHLRSRSHLFTFTRSCSRLFTFTRFCSRLFMFTRSCSRLFTFICSCGSVHYFLTVWEREQLRQVRDHIISTLASNGCTSKEIRTFVLEECSERLRFHVYNYHYRLLSRLTTIPYSLRQIQRIVKEQKE